MKYLMDSICHIQFFSELIWLLSSAPQSQTTTLPSPSNIKTWKARCDTKSNTCNQYNMESYHKMAADTCQFCPSVFLSSLSLERHVQETHLHPGEPKCGQCSYRSPDQHLLTMHMRQSHKDSEGMDKNQGSLNIHMGSDINKDDKVDAADGITVYIDAALKSTSSREKSVRGSSYSRSDEDPLIEMLEVQKHMSNVTIMIAALKNKLASVTRQRNELFGENGMLKDRVARLEKRLEERSSTVQKSHRRNQIPLKSLAVKIN